VETEKAKLDPGRKEGLAWLKLANEHVRALESQPTVAALSVESAWRITSSLAHKLFVFFTFLPLVCGADAWGRNIWRRSLQMRENGYYASGNARGALQGTRKALRGVHTCFVSANTDVLMQELKAAAEDAREKQSVS